MIATLSNAEREASLFWLRRELLRSDLVEFCCHIDPKAERAYRAKHLVHIARELERVERGECKRLFVTAPPRHWKSSLVSEKFPLWYLSRHPEASVGIFSHGASLPIRFSRNVRGNIIGNPLYRQLFPDVRLREDSTRVADWSLVGAHRNSFSSYGVGSAPTGTGFELIIIDDPVGDAAEAYSPHILESIWTWYKETLRDRLNPGGVILICMSRWHENDLPGHLIRDSKTGDGEHWDELKLPAIAEANDPLWRQKGEALWPEMWPLVELEAARKAQGSRAFSARYQGSPKAMDGNLLSSAKLIMVNLDQVQNIFVKIVRHWDLAFSEDPNADWAAGAKLGLDKNGNRWILHVRKLRGRWPVVKPEIIRWGIEDGVNCVVSVEANGTQLGYYQDVRADQRLSNRTVVSQHPEGSKEMRASMWGSRLEDGIIYCVRGAWNQELFDQMDAFPNAEHDDIVDGVSGAWAQLNNAGVPQAIGEGNRAASALAARRERSLIG